MDSATLTALEINEWQIAGVQRAIKSLEAGKGVSHQEVKDWVMSWGSGDVLSMPKPRRTDSNRAA